MLPPTVPRANGGMANQAHRFKRQPLVFPNDGGSFQSAVPGQRADEQRSVTPLDIGKIGKLVDIDEATGLYQPEVHHRDQALPTARIFASSPCCSRRESASSIVAGAKYSKGAGFIRQPPMERPEPHRRGLRLIPHQVAQPGPREPNPIPFRRFEKNARSSVWQSDEEALPHRGEQPTHLGHRIHGQQGLAGCRLRRDPCWRPRAQPGAALPSTESL